ncbi:MAG: hypothetical protein JXQ80_12190 [Bacteroidales bacterium]|nr:hypothetical protein [Bacteroidales bacterium]
MAWITAASFLVAINILLYNAKDIVKKYKEKEDNEAKAAMKLVHSLDSINNALVLSLEDIKKNVTLTYGDFQHEFTSIKLQLLVQDKKIEILSGHITGYEDMIRKEFLELDNTLKRFVAVNNDSLTIKYFKR